MTYRWPGSTGLMVSTVGTGTRQFGGERGKSFTRKEVDVVLGEAREQGPGRIPAGRVRL